MFSLSEKLINMAWEFRLGINTRGLAGVDSADDEHIHYGTIPYRSINTLLDNLHLAPNDIFVDLGSGKGRVICCASRTPIQEAIGVECSEPLSAVARGNIVTLRGNHAPIKTLTIEAQQFDYSVGTVFYLFHPFGPETLRTVVDQLHEGILRVPRIIRIVYVNPVHDNVLRECSWLTEYDRWENGNSRSLEHPVSWWTNDIKPL